MAESSDTKITEMMARLMGQQEEYMKDMWTCMTRLEEGKLKKRQVENFEDEDEPIWDKEDRNKYENSESQQCQARNSINKFKVLVSSWNLLLKHYFSESS